MAKEQPVTRLDSTYMKHYDAYMERHQKKKKRLIRRLVMFVLLVMVVAGAMVMYHVNQQSIYAEKQQHYQKLQTEMSSLKEKKKDLKEEVEMLNNEDYVLQIARSDYFFSKKGEIIFKMPNEDPSY